MDQTGEVLGLRLARQQSNLAAVADAKSGPDVLVVFERDILLREKIGKPVAVRAYFAADAVLEL